MTTRFNRIALLLLLFVFVAPDEFAQTQGTRDAQITLRHYIDLRLNWADWNVYSKFITWPDEPGWDCWWVTTDYVAGQARGNSKRVVIPVTYKRLGMFCVDAQFEPGQMADTVKYELIREHGEWKIDGPTPDRPYVGLHAVRNNLSKTISDASESPERRAKARDALALIEKLSK